MKRRKFIKTSVLVATASLALSGSVSAKEPFETLIENMKNIHELVKYDKNHKFRVMIHNVHVDYFKNSSMEKVVIEDDSLHPFSFGQGDFAIMLLPMTGGAVQSLLYKHEKNKYVLVGKNIGNAKKSEVSWPEIGIEVDIENISKT